MTSDSAPGRPLWAMLAALTTTFSLSQAFRTLPAVVVGRIADDFAITPTGIGIFAGAFALAFGAMQLVVGVALDRFGPRRTACAVFPFAIAGCLLSAFAPSFAWLVVGQGLIGVGCAPAYISTLVFLVRRYPAHRFASLSGLTMSVGGIGMLATATPLAWVVQTFGWRYAFVILAVASLGATIACFVLVDERAEDIAAQETIGEAIRGIAPILRMPQTAGILVLGACLYGAFLSVRTPWIVPLFENRYGFSLVEAGNMVLVFSIVMVASPLMFGRIDPGGRRRRYLMIAMSFVLAALIAALGVADKSGWIVDLALVIAIAGVSGFAMLEYPDLRSSFPAAIVGRAIALLNMAMFFGVAVVQSLAGAVATAAAARGADPVGPIFFVLAGLLVAATTAYWALPWPKHFDAPELSPPDTD